MWLHLVVLKKYETVHLNHIFCSSQTDIHTYCKLKALLRLLKNKIEKIYLNIILNLNFNLHYVYFLRRIRLSENIGKFKCH